MCIGFPGSSDSKVSSGNVGDSGSIPGLGRSPGEGNGNPLQYPCLENPWTEEPGRLQSTGLQRDGHNLVIELTQMEKSPLAIQETQVQSLGWEDPLEK